MLLTASVKVELKVDGKLMVTKKWDKVDIMKTAHTRGYALKLLNRWIKDFNSSNGMGRRVVSVDWECVYDRDNSNRFSGRLSQVSGGDKTIYRRGIFDQ